MVDQKKILISIVIASFILFIKGCGSSSPEDVAKQFINFANQRKYDKAINLLTNEEKQKVAWFRDLSIQIFNEITKNGTISVISTLKEKRWGGKQKLNLNLDIEMV